MQLVPQRRGQRDQRELRRPVGAHQRRGHTPADRADRDDSPAAFAQRRQQRLRQLDQRERVQLQRLLQAVAGHGLERREARCTRTVHQAAQPRRVELRRCQHRAQPRRDVIGRQIHDQRHDHLRRQRRGPLGRAHDRDHAVASRDEAPRDRGADATAGARDDDVAHAP
ncbi:MAG: hypothetical protein U0168_16240 [Nannocystaceae bacterium]